MAQAGGHSISTAQPSSPLPWHDELSDHTPEAHL